MSARARGGLREGFRKGWGGGAFVGEPARGSRLRATCLCPSGARHRPAAKIEFLFPYLEKSWDGRAVCRDCRGRGSLGRTWKLDLPVCQQRLAGAHGWEV